MMELTLAGCRFRMDFGFPAMLALLLLHAEGSFLLQTLAVCLLHECGHGLAMLLTGAGLREVSCSAAGVQMRTAASLLPAWKETTILLSGPLANLLAALLLYGFGGEGELVGLHLLMGLGNLLPYRLLDGGSLLRLWLGDAACLRAACIFLSCLLSVALWMLGIRNFGLFAMLLYLGLMELCT